MNIINTLIVHAGIFHTDDVLCAAFAQILNPKVKIIRTNHVTDDMTLENGILVADIGGGRFDHHQKDAVTDANGLRYAACELMFHEFKDEIFPDEVPTDFLCILRRIGLTDNYGPAAGPRTEITGFVNSCIPTWEETKTMDQAFLDAVQAVKVHFVIPAVRGKKYDGRWFLESDMALDRKVANDTAEDHAKVIVQSAIVAAGDKPYIVLDKFVPWQKQGAEYAVFPALRGGYALVCDMGGHLPESWITTKPEGCNFVHAARFMASFDTLEQAIATAETL